MRGWLLLFSLIAACSNSDAGTDFGVVEPGCRAPSACYLTGADCSCRRGELETACKVCDPNLQDCICQTGQVCTQGPNVCVGRAITVCGGVGARCLPAGSTCASSGGIPPTLIGQTDGGTLEAHCAFVDDVCCPGDVNADAGL
jgi:hypothetical protein